MFSRSNIQEVLPTSHRCAQERSMWKESNYVGGYTYKTLFLNPGWIHSTHLHPCHIEELDKGEKKVSFKDTWALILLFDWLYVQALHVSQRPALAHLSRNQHWQVQPRHPGVNRQVSVDFNTISCADWASGPAGRSCEQEEGEKAPPHPFQFNWQEGFSWGF